MSTLNTLDQFDAAPIGTVVKGEYGTRVKTEEGENGFGWVYAESGELGQLSPFMPYEVIYSPAPEVEEIDDPIGDLSKKLWEIRNESLADSHFRLTPEFETGWHEVTYRAIAEYVIDEFASYTLTTHPSQVLDKLGDTWTLRSNGLYSIGDDVGGWSSFEDIEANEGIASVVA